MLFNLDPDRLLRLLFFFNLVDTFDVLNPRNSSRGRLDGSTRSCEKISIREGVKLLEKQTVHMNVQDGRL